MLTPLAVASLRGSEAGMGQYLVEVIHKVVPNWTVVSERDTLSLINEHGLEKPYALMRSDAELSHVLDRDTLREIGQAVGARFIFQPRLAFYSQYMMDRWEVPPIGLKVGRTRAATMRLSLQLWDSSRGELIWYSVAEANLQSEAMSLDPVFMEDAARVTFGSMLADLVNRKTASEYTPLNHVLNMLIEEKAQDLSKDSTPEGTENKAPEIKEKKQEEMNESTANPPNS